MSFFGSLFGGDATKAIKKSSKKAEAQLGAGYQEGNQYYNQGYDQLTPFTQQGQNAYTTYGNALGLNGQDAQRTAEATYFNDPAMQSVLSQQSNALLRQINARGGGTNTSQLGQAGAKIGLQNYQNWLGQLQGLGQQGGQYATNQSNIRLGQGDLRYGYGATLAGNSVNTGNALAQASQLPINNLLGIVGAGARFAGGFNGVSVR
jgi:hypothetical protein